MDNIIGCGIDIEELNRFEEYLEGLDHPLLHDVYTKEELKYILQGDVKTGLALSFSCKEALFKAMGKSWTNSKISWKDIELLFYDSAFSKYDVKISGYAEKLFLMKDGKKIESYFDFNNDFVVFQIILLS